MLFKIFLLLFQLNQPIKASGIDFLSIVLMQIYLLIVDERHFLIFDSLEKLLSFCLIFNKCVYFILIKVRLLNNFRKQVKIANIEKPCHSLLRRHVRNLIFIKHLSLQIFAGLWILDDICKRLVICRSMPV